MALNLMITSAGLMHPTTGRPTSGSRAPPATARLSAPLGSRTLSGGRVAAVVASPGGSARPVPLSRRRCTTAGNNHQPPQSDLEYFLEEMKKFKESHPMAAKAIPNWNRFDAAYFANKCLELIEELLKKYNPRPLPADTLQEVCRIGRSFLELVVKHNSKSLRFEDIEMVIPGLIRIAAIFPVEVDREDCLHVKDQPSLLPFGRFRETYYRVKSKYPRIN